MRKIVYLPIRQQGLVLFIALIALVVMSLAAVALIRSVDTNTMIAGNLAFRQTALVATDRGTEAAMFWIANTWEANKSSLNENIPAEGYFATYVAGCTGEQDPGGNEMNAIQLVDSCGTVGVADDGLGNEIRYVIQRMCYNPYTLPPYDAEERFCMLGDAETGDGSLVVKDGPEAGIELDSEESPVYRITVKVTGPKNSISYAQTFVY